jgi:hypothetical protein
MAVNQANLMSALRPLSVVPAPLEKLQKLSHCTIHIRKA